MIFPQTTAQVASILALFQIILMLRVGLYRLNSNIGIGSGGNDTLERRIRVHGNLIENAPIFLILLGLLEISGMGQGAIAGLGLAFFLARISHAYALSKTSGPHPLRAVGAMGTTLSIVGTSSALLWQTFFL